MIKDPLLVEVLEHPLSVELAADLDGQLWFTLGAVVAQPVLDLLHMDVSKRNTYLNTVHWQHTPWKCEAANGVPGAM